ncbi:MAG: hypothetical protein HND57_00845 [Planctomycetes bacterium]|nr:hypothetical protein [Planctomycetota bacterium]
MAHPRHPPSRYRACTALILLLLLLLLLGAATTVGVAWVCASWDWPGREYVYHKLRRTDTGWVIAAASGFGSDMRNAYSAQADLTFDNVDDSAWLVPPWSVLESPPATEMACAFEQVAGWPFRSLHCHWSAAHVRLPWRDIDASGVLGGTLANAQSPNNLATPLMWYRGQALPFLICPTGFVLDLLVWTGVWALLILLGLAPFLVRNARRFRHGRCQRCAYDLHGSESNRCSECGWPIGRRLPLITSRTTVTVGLLLVALLLTESAIGYMSHRAPWGPHRIHLAARDGDIDRLERHLRSGTTTNELITSGPSDLHDTTPLMWAALGGSVESIEALAAHGADMDACDKNDWTALHWAAKYDNADAVYALVRLGADVNAVDRFGMSPLVVCCFSPYQEPPRNAIRALLDHHPDLESVAFSTSALGWAARNGAADVVRMLIDAGADVDGPIAGPSPLMYAARTGHLDLVMMLLEAGADYRDRDKDIVEQAVISGNVELVSFLLELGAPAAIMYSARGEGLLFEAMWRPDIEMMDLLIGAGCDPTMKSNTGETILFIGDWASDAELATYLMTLDIDLNAQQNSTDQTVLMQRAGATWVDVAAVRYLLAAGADPMIMDAQGMTARDHAERAITEWAIGGQDTAEVEEIIQILKDAEETW